MTCSDVARISMSIPQPRPLLTNKYFLLRMALDYVDAKNQIYIPAALLIVGVGITKTSWLPFAFILTAALVYLKLHQHSLTPPLLPSS